MVKEGKLTLQKMRGEFLANKFWKVSFFLRFDDCEEYC